MEKTTMFTVACEIVAEAAAETSWLALMTAAAAAAACWLPLVL